MTKNAIKLAAALFTLAAATGCQPVAEIECATLEECGIDWQMDPGFLPPMAEEATVELAAPPVFDHGLATFRVKHPAVCEAPELVLHVQAIGRSMPATALASLELFPGSCDVRTPGDATPTVPGTTDLLRSPVLSDLTLDLSDALPSGVCVGHVVLFVPELAGDDGDSLRFTLDSEVCGAGAPSADQNLNSHG